MSAGLNKKRMGFSQRMSKDVANLIWQMATADDRIKLQAQIDILQKENAYLNKRNARLQELEAKIQGWSPFARITVQDVRPCHNLECSSTSYGLTCDRCLQVECKNCVTSASWLVCDDCDCAWHRACTDKDIHDNCPRCGASGMLVELTTSFFDRGREI